MQTLNASDIAAFLGAPLTGTDIRIDRAATLDSASPHSVVFLKKPDTALFANIAAHKNILALLPNGMDAGGISAIYCANPRFEFARVLEKFFRKPQPQEFIDKSAIIDPSAKLGSNVRVGPYSIIGADVVIGDNTEIRSHVTIAQGVVIGRDCLIKSSAVIGEEGFGFERDADGINMRIHHIGAVTIGDRVEIGALTSICCGTIDNTIIGDDTKIDDHVFIAHNVKTGKNCIIIAASEISGSVKLGDNVWLAPATTIINGVEVGAGALLGIGSIITKSVEPKSVMGGARATFIRYVDEAKKA